MISYSENIQKVPAIYYFNLNNKNISNMKGSKSTLGLTHKKNKSKLQSPATNNFSEKYMQFTKEKLFSNTPKKSSVSNTVCSPRSTKTGKSVKDKKRPASPYASKQQKININMEIKNFNIYNRPTDSGASTGLRKKKKLHKKTISCLNSSPPHHENAFKNSPKQKTRTLKHKKAKSQQNLSYSPEGWSNLLAQYGKNEKKVQQVVSKYAICNRCGYCPDKKNKVNQDSYIALQHFMKKGRYLFGVCDGHGINGHFVSEFVKQILPENIEYSFLKNKNLKKAAKGSIESSLKDAFQKTAKNLVQSGIDIMFSGTTTCLIYIDNHDLFCANLGDSRAVLYNKETNSNQEEWSAHELSTDHKAQDKRQAIRIQMNGGRVFPYRDEDGEQMGPYRIWLKDQNIPGLAMTRSFGDYIASTVGVIDQPQIIHHTIVKQNKFAVVASDGLWEFISKQQVLNVVAPAFVRNDPHSAVKDLQKMAVEAWEREDQSIDDITIVVIFFKYY